jgi:hypothetical protein
MDFAIPESTQRMARAIRDFMHREVYPLEPDLLNGSFRGRAPDEHHAPHPGKADEGPSPSHLRRIKTGPVGL